MNLVWCKRNEKVYRVESQGITLGKMQIGRMVKIFHFYIRFKSVLKQVYNIYGRNQVLVRGAAA